MLQSDYRNLKNPAVNYTNNKPLPKMDETLRGVYPECNRRAQGDKRGSVRVAKGAQCEK
jgi:hypothetical protein